MKEIISIISIIILFASSPAYAHKLITHDDSHRDIDNALKIPDHKISWAIYENLGVNEAKFYSFDSKKGESLYASIVIPKIEGLEKYSPTLILVSPENNQNVNNIQSQNNIKKFPYEGNFPSNEFYEPFGQVTYWERQEINTELSADGEYFIIVLDEKNQKGKYSLAIGTIEDFSSENIFLILPQSWWETKIFVNDYISIMILFFIIIILILITAFAIKRKIKNKSLS
ncbi:hypothetical protein [Candidatus Nitrosopumilus sediminis]|uniref:Uncharacterized protein n=1 Tax=Candidatus Nitrosopumilus sediminis TaxID=1229909 RepID=K0BD35_9ARCH|nr:hypothetical protein [Candidatus Nitrosopumilus sediminis]AFS82920.1 hypothetical protein NSED_05590 [Candidatus Nitrosopumilus sediminis]